MDLLNVKSPTKSEAQVIAKEIINPALEGEVNSLDIRLKLDFISQVVKEAKENVLFKETCFHELGLHGQETTLEGVKMTQGQSVQYIFPDSIQEFEKQCKEAVKKIKELSKSTQAGATSEFINPFNGELIKVTNAIKKSTDVVKVTLPK